MLRRPQNPDRLQHKLIFRIILHRLAVKLNPALQQVPQVLPRTLCHQRHHDRSPLHMMNGCHQSVISRIHRSRSDRPVRPRPHPLSGGTFGRLLQIRCRTSLYLSETLTPAPSRFFTTCDLFCHSPEYPPTEICYREPSAMTANAFSSRTPLEAFNNTTSPALTFATSHSPASSGLATNNASTPRAFAASTVASAAPRTPRTNPTPHSAIRNPQAACNASASGPSSSISPATAICRSAGIAISASTIAFSAAGFEL